MIKKRLKAVIIGGGIHGITSSLALAEKGIDVTVIEKRPGVLEGTSGSTHNRAHLGYHYPRSTETAIECLRGLEFFKKKYPHALFYPPEAYYFIEKERSKTSSEEFKKFCDKIGIPYKAQLPENRFINPNSVEGSFMVSEPVFDIKTLRDSLRKECFKMGIAIKNNSELVGYEKIAPKHKLIVKEKGIEKSYEADLIINSSYAHTNNILRILELEKDIIPYKLQTTEVAITRSPETIPAMTIMDGEFISLMPLANSANKNVILVYDVVYSVVNEKVGYYFDDSQIYTSNFGKMVEHGERYFPFMKKLEYIDSLWGSRPIPLNNETDSRKTKIISHKDAPGIYSILEGKFISAPLIAERLANKIIEEYQ